jgi:hypothetical protein
MQASLNLVEAGAPDDLTGSNDAESDYLYDAACEALLWDPNPPSADRRATRPAKRHHGAFWEATKKIGSP